MLAALTQDDVQDDMIVEEQAAPGADHPELAEEMAAAPLVLMPINQRAKKW
jgi:hypothetical protein